MWRNAWRKRAVLLTVCGAVALVAIAAGGAVYRDKPTSESDAPANDGGSAKPGSTGKPRTAAGIAAEKRKRTAAAMSRFRKDVSPFLKKYCYQCHGPKDQEEGVAFHKLTDAKSVFAARKLWEKVHRMLESDAMPPKEHAHRPQIADRKRVSKWIEDSVFAVDCQLVDDPGRVTIRRLNRAEYNNTIRDLVGVNFNPAKDFPSDDVGYGFDNIGDVLTLPPLLMEKYLDAAEQIAGQAIDPDSAARKTKRVAAAQMRKSGGAGDVNNANGFRALPSNGEVFATFHFPKTGEYLLRAEAMADQAGDAPAMMEFQINGKTVKAFDVTGRREAKIYEWKVKVKAGDRKFGAAFTNDYYNPKAKRRRGRDRNLYVKFLEIRGPIGIRVSAPPAIHKRIVFAVPGKNKTVQQAATEVLAKFLRRAFRRPVTNDEVQKYVRLVEYVIKHGDNYERGIQLAVQAILVSPHFLFRVESDRDPKDPNKKRSLNDHELAVRLSYFLWSSMPDDELFRLADGGKLNRRDVMEQQVRRMLKDPKSQALVQNFGAQWLNLRSLDEVTPDRKRFKTFTDKLRRDMRTETEMFFTAVMREDRSILDFLDARYTFLNERLAKHYGVPGVKGEKFRRVELKGDHRAGVLTQASILTITSNPTRTSPVKRGKWVLENIFDQKPPDPPPNVPPLDEKKVAAGNLSLRKQLEIHRANAVCASCHTTMDAIGFGFENFDAVGRWREKDGQSPVDASGELPGGAKFNGPLQLVNILKKRKADFATCFGKKMLTFALGRGLEYYDKCAVDSIAAAAAKHDYRFSSFVLAVVNSEPFLLRRSETREKPK
jgi:Protein of unknown function (DUF1592)/Protein of unknown function (DUF1588)/Protein of unknown function (DUF1587)/Protein of unknown function (DUF1585)/Protein of unknown function (DUF1595)/Ca-dependent carbohydrate-binding module xylan-binding/Planctomycete cytochrome C